METVGSCISLRLLKRSCLAFMECEALPLATHLAAASQLSLQDLLLHPSMALEVTMECPLELTVFSNRNATGAVAANPEELPKAPVDGTSAAMMTSTADNKAKSDQDSWDRPPRYVKLQQRREQQNKKRLLDAERQRAEEATRMSLQRTMVSRTGRHAVPWKGNTMWTPDSKEDWVRWTEPRPLEQLTVESQRHLKDLLDNVDGLAARPTAFASYSRGGAQQHQSGTQADVVPATHQDWVLGTQASPHRRGLAHSDSSTVPSFEEEVQRSILAFVESRLEYDKIRHTPPRVSSCRLTRFQDVVGGEDFLRARPMPGYLVVVVTLYVNVVERSVLPGHGTRWHHQQLFRDSILVSLGPQPLNAGLLEQEQQQLAAGGLPSGAAAAAQREDNLARWSAREDALRALARVRQSRGAPPSSAHHLTASAASPSSSNAWAGSHAAKELSLLEELRDGGSMAETLVRPRAERQGGLDVPTPLEVHSDAWKLRNTTASTSIDTLLSSWLGTGLAASRHLAQKSLSNGSTPIEEDGAREKDRTGTAWSGPSGSTPATASAAGARSSWLMMGYQDPLLREEPVDTILGNGVTTTTLRFHELGRRVAAGGGGSVVGSAMRPSHASSSPSSSLVLGAHGDTDGSKPSAAAAAAPQSILEMEVHGALRAQQQAATSWRPPEGRSDPWRSVANHYNPTPADTLLRHHQQHGGRGMMTAAAQRMPTSKDAYAPAATGHTSARSTGFPSETRGDPVREGMAKAAAPMTSAVTAASASVGAVAWNGKMHSFLSS